MAKTIVPSRILSLRQVTIVKFYYGENYSPTACGDGTQGFLVISKMADTMVSYLALQGLTMVGTILEKNCHQLILYLIFALTRTYYGKFSITKKP